MNTLKTNVRAIVITLLSLSHTAFAPPIRIRIPPEAVHVVPRIRPIIEVPPVRPRVGELPHVTAHSGESLTSKAISIIPDVIDTAIDVCIKQSQAAPTQQDKRQHLDESFLQGKAACSQTISVTRQTDTGCSSL